MLTWFWYNLSMRANGGESVKGLVNRMELRSAEMTNGPRQRWKHSKQRTRKRATPDGLHDDVQTSDGANTHTQTLVKAKKAGQTKLTNLLMMWSDLHRASAKRRLRSCSRKWCSFRLQCKGQSIFIGGEP